MNPLSLAQKLRLTARVWRRFLAVRTGFRRDPLPAYVERLGRTETTAARIPPARLSRAVARSLRVGGRRPTCLVSSLVLFRLLREQGDAAELVVGLPLAGESPDAHAWVEIRGVDVGPPPGRSGHDEMARFS
jgi:hypothetical protein